MPTPTNTSSSPCWPNTSSSHPRYWKKKTRNCIKCCGPCSIRTRVACFAAGRSAAVMTAMLHAPAAAARSIEIAAGGKLARVVRVVQFGIVAVDFNNEEPTMDTPSITAHGIVTVDGGRKFRNACRCRRGSNSPAVGAAHRRPRGITSPQPRSNCAERFVPSECKVQPVVHRNFRYFASTTLSSIRPMLTW